MGQHERLNEAAGRPACPAADGRIYKVGSTDAKNDWKISALSHPVQRCGSFGREERYHRSRGAARERSGSSGHEQRLHHSGLRGLPSGAFLHRQEELELRRKLLLRVQAIREVDAAQPAVRVDLNAKRLDVVRTVRTAREVRQVELDLVPAFVQ